MPFREITDRAGSVNRRTETTPNASAGRTRGIASTPAFPAPLGTTASFAPASPADSSAAAEETYNLRLLDRSRERWETSAQLREVYGSIYRDMARHATPGPAIEIGSGAGTIKEFLPQVVTSDIRRTRYVDEVASAYALDDVARAPWSTIYALDVLHHLREPFRFFASAAQALRPGGRIVVCDPAASFWGRWFYRSFHREPTNPDRVQRPYEFAPDSPHGDFANMGMAWALFVRDREVVAASLARMGLSIQAVRFRDCLAYAASGGFSGPKLLPVSWLRGLLALEQRTPQALLRLFGLRLVVVLERATP